MTTDAASYQRQVAQTLQSLNTVPDATLVSLTGMGIDAIQAIKQEVAEIFPASNLPAFLLQGLVQLSDRTLAPERVAADLGVLFRGSKQIGLYGAFLAAPALVIHGYQKLLALAGKDAESAFPDGPWQFYTEFGLREDAARHGVETVGFERVAAGVGPAAAAACWVCACLEALFGYDDLLACEWEERVVPRTLDLLLAEQAEAELSGSLPRKAEARARAIADAADALRQRYGVDRLAAGWAARRPYAAPPGTTLAAYLALRQEQFRAYLAAALTSLAAEQRAELERRVAARREGELPAFQRQMSILATLDPGPYQDRRSALGIEVARVALVTGGQYHLLDACARDAHGSLLIFPLDGDGAGVSLALTRDADGALRDRMGNPVAIDRRGQVQIGQRRLGRLRPPSPAQVRSWVERVLGTQPPGAPVGGDAGDLLLAEAPRERQGELRALLDAAGQAAVAAVRAAPIILSWDARDGGQPLAVIRRTRRGVGDHAITLVRTDRSTVFDLSHIFFDGSWGMALAEILTGAAIAALPRVMAAEPAATPASSAATLVASPALRAAAAQAVAASPVEASAETDAVDLARLNQLRQRLTRVRLVLTVNDLLVLGRCAHAASYRPGPRARRALEELGALPGGPGLVATFTRHIEEQRAVNPALLIPMDAAATDPRLRLFPATFRNPRPELLARLDRCRALVEQLHQQPDPATAELFAAERRDLYADLQTFGATLRVLKQVTMRGESFTTAALRLLGHLPGAMQHLVDLIPQKIGVLNEILKGREVFSNVGQAAPASSLTRFVSARDDGQTKLLIWGIMSQVDGRLVVTLRDFRPHVRPLVALGRADLAQELAQDYLDDYATTANGLVRRIHRILAQQ